MPWDEKVPVRTDVESLRGGWENAGEEVGRAGVRRWLSAGCGSGNRRSVIGSPGMQIGGGGGAEVAWR